MSTFDQRGQQVAAQYNAAGDINFAGSADGAGLAAELEKLVGEVRRTLASDALSGEAASTVEAELSQAAQEAGSRAPLRQTILERLEAAASLLNHAATVSGAAVHLLPLVEQAIERAQKLF